MRSIVLLISVLVLLGGPLWQALAGVHEAGPPDDSEKRREQSLIDDHIFGKMEADGIPHAGPATDVEFMRRLYLDLWGQIASVNAIQRFVADTDSNNRNRLIDQLLGLDYLRLRQVVLDLKQNHEDRLTLTDKPVEVRPGIVFETTGGHHPGSGAVRVQTADGVIGILETAFLQRNVDEVRPVGVAENVAACRQAIRRYKEECDVVVAIHDPSNAERFMC